MYRSLGGIMDRVGVGTVGWALAYVHPLLCGHGQTATSGSCRCDFPSGRHWTWNCEPDEPFSLKLLLLGYFIIVNRGLFPKSLLGDSNVKPVLAKY